MVDALGEPIESGVHGLCRLAPTAERVADAGVQVLTRLAVPEDRAHTLATVAREVSLGTLHLAPGADPAATRLNLMAIDGVTAKQADMIVLRALHWPDTCGFAHPVSAAEAKRWSPWRAYAGLHLLLNQRDELGTRS